MGMREPIYPKPIMDMFLKKQWLARQSDRFMAICSTAFLQRLRTLNLIHCRWTNLESLILFLLMEVEFGMETENIKTLTVMVLLTQKTKHFWDLLYRSINLVSTTP